MIKISYWSYKSYMIKCNYYDKLLLLVRIIYNIISMFLKETKKGTTRFVIMKVFRLFYLYGLPATNICTGLLNSISPSKRLVKHVFIFGLKTRVSECRVKLLCNMAENNQI